MTDEHSFLLTKIKSSCSYANNYHQYTGAEEKEQYCRTQKTLLFDMNTSNGLLESLLKLQPGFDLMRPHSQCFRFNAVN